MFFEKGEPTKEIWVYDYRTGIKTYFGYKANDKGASQDFVDCYCTGHMQDRVATYSAENPNGRWRCFSEKEVKNADNLDFKWIDLEEKGRENCSRGYLKICRLNLMELLKR